MSDDSGRYWITYNGEIYNYVELRRELQDLGITFRTRSDTEVLIQALVRWREAALDRLHGMFAFVFFAVCNQSLFAARDRFGIKPLYIAESGSGIAFASEIKQLLGLPGLVRRMNLARVRDFLEFGISDHTGETLFTGVRQLRGGECLSIELTSPRRVGVEPRRWYRLPVPGSLDLPLEAASERLKNLFSESVKMHLRSDVSVGSCLSGGLDSSSIVMEASRQLDAAAKMTTVSAVFKEVRVNERAHAEAVIAAAGAAGRFISFSPDDVLEVADDVIWHQDEPFGSTSILAQWFVFAEARRAGIKVMLDGQGADEPLAGYHWLFAPALADLLRAGEVQAAARQILARRAATAVSIRRQIVDAAAFLAPRFLRAMGRRWRRRAGGQDWLAGSALASIKGSIDPLALGGTPEHADGKLFPALLLKLTLETSLPMLLHWEDRNSMAHGIEARVPFLDHRLVELAIGLGARHKIQDAKTKVLLRRALGELLPRQILERNEKLGFATPELEWVTGPLRDAMRSAVEATLALYPELLDREATLALADEMLARRRPFDFSLWRIACVGLWGKRYQVNL